MSMFAVLIGASLLAVSVATDCDGECVPRFGNCLESHNCCEDTRCVKKNDYYAQCVPYERAVSPDWDGSVLQCGESPPDCTGECVPRFGNCLASQYCCEGTRCVMKNKYYAQCVPDDREAKAGWDGSVLQCAGGMYGGDYGPGTYGDYGGPESPPLEPGTPAEPPAAPPMPGPSPAPGPEPTMEPPSGDEPVVVNYDGSWTGLPGCVDPNICCETFDDDYQQFDYPSLLTPSADGEDCVIGSEGEELEFPPPGPLCGYGYREPCAPGGTALIFARDFGCQGLGGSEDCIKYCRECTSERDAAVEEFLDSWIEVPVKEDGCLGEIKDIFVLFETMVEGKPERTVGAQPNIRNRQILSPDSLIDGDNPGVCVPCGWPELPVCDTEPPCDNGSFLVVEDGYCKIPS